MVHMRAQPLELLGGLVHVRLELGALLVGAQLLRVQRLAQLLHLGIRCAEEELERLDLLARGVRLALRRLELLRVLGALALEDLVELGGLRGRLGNKKKNASVITRWCQPARRKFLCMQILTSPLCMQILTRQIKHLPHKVLTLVKSSTVLENMLDACLGG